MEQYINKEVFVQLLTEYFYLKERTYFEVVPMPYVKYSEFGPTIDMTTYLERTICGEKERVPLTEDDIKQALSARLNTDTKVLDSYLYVGGVRHVGLYVDEDTPYFDGVKLYFKEKKKKKDWYLQKK